MVADSDLVLSRYLERNPSLLAEWRATRKLKIDPRVTRVGRLLRRSSLDELPQFWNVLDGDMSMVGPRPIVEEETAKYGPALDLYLQVKPGLTGLWQVSGRNDTSYRQRTALDSAYIQNWTLWTDFAVLLKTVRVVLYGHGASNALHCSALLPAGRLTPHTASARIYPAMHSKCQQRALDGQVELHAHFRAPSADHNPCYRSRRPRQPAKQAYIPMNLSDILLPIMRHARGLLALLLLGSVLRHPPARFGVDPRVELMSIIFRLAGNNEYTQGRIPAYNTAIDGDFAPFRNHEAVRLARRLRDNDGVSYDAVMNMAVHVKDVESLAEHIRPRHNTR